MSLFRGMNMLTDKGFFSKLKLYIGFAGPSTIFFITVIILPFIYGVYITFTNWDGISSHFSFVGFENYIKIFHDKDVISSFLITIEYVFAIVILTNVIAFIFAYILTSGIKGYNFFRVGFFTPNLIGGVILGFLWSFIFSNILVYFGKTSGIGLFSNSWLGNPQKAFWALVLVTVWQQSGYMMIIYIAGLISIPQEVLEAARIDGATGLRKIKNIILPLIVPSLVVCIFLTMHRGFLVYELNLALTNGGPFGSTELIAMHIYRTAFIYQKYGTGQAAAFFLFMIAVIIALIQVYFSKRIEVEL